MVTEGVVLGHRVSGRSIVIDQERIEVIENLPYPQDVKGMQTFMGHASFYRRFIKDFSEISKPLTDLLYKDVPYSFDKHCMQAYEKLRDALITAPIIQPPKWDEPFEIMCDTSNYAVGAILGQRDDKKLNVVFYASRSLDEDQKHLATTEKELLAIVFACDKFRPYIINSKVIVHTDHHALRYLLAKKDAKP
jgi:hypothetical protein